MKQVAARLLGSLMAGGMAAACLAGCGSKTSGEKVTGVVVHTTVTPGGEFPDYLDVSLIDFTRRKMDPEDFSMTGHATNWLDPSEHDFTASFREVENRGGSLRLWFDDFADKYFFVTDWEVTYDLDAALCFTSDAITEVETPVADDFTEETMGPSDNPVTYRLYAPKDPGDGAVPDRPLPVVIVFHGYGDTENIRAYRTSVAWAEPANQAVRPCYVLSPVIENDAYMDPAARKEIYGMVVDTVQEMADAGEVDPDRVYLMGNSFGGMATVECMEEYPDFAAGGIVLCGALNYSPDGLSTERLLRITDIPLYLAAAEHDSTIPSSVTKYLAKQLTDLGDTKVQMKIYTDEEMNAAGADADPDSTFSYHHVEMAVMEDPAYMEWLFAAGRE